MEDLFSYFGFLVFSSIVEGLFWSRYRGTYEKWSFDNPHGWLVLMRCSVWVMFLPDWMLVSAMILSFPFFHDGIYYTTRHLINKDDYPKHFFDVSTTSKALSMSFKWRLILMIVASHLFILGW